MTNFNMVVRCAVVFTMAAWLLPFHHAVADDLVASVLPLSRSPVVGQTATTFATVINTSGQALNGCSVTLPNFPGQFAYQSTNPTTNALMGTQDQPFNLEAGGVQTLVLFLQPTETFSPTPEGFQFQCTNAMAAASIMGVDTLLLSANATPQPDIVALAATPSGDGVVRMSGVGSPQAFAVSTVNVGGAGTITVSASTGAIPLPLQTQICQTTPSTGECLAPPSPTVTASIGENETSTFSIFTTATAPIPLFPTNVRLLLSFTDSNDIVRGETGVALTTDSMLATGQTAGGFYIGNYLVTSGPFLGATGEAVLLIAENGQMEGVTFDPTGANIISALFTGNAALNDTFQYISSGTIFPALGFFLPENNLSSPIVVNGAVSPRNFMAGTFSLNDETGIFYVAYNEAVYQVPSSLGTVAGVWNIRNLQNEKIGALTVNQDGNFNGSDINGCSYSGAISIINSKFNAYNIQLAISECSSVNGSYGGLGLLQSTQSSNDTLQFELSSSTLIETNAITRF